ncbi:ankyrin repeat domain-containing protein [Spirillospora sp. NBC_01491]|uniref:ankyrin repeat domain-containing protein n=1 Tax=Spirillospora sp. NBC_01491 TaxID=2976007 RepID=UPI002E311795|nr:ankyrin repeat domain-containing protein [Spirillospora sp. NBC_01491]
MPTPVSKSRPPDEMSRLRRIRRYAVPRWMIEQATERRLAGDWQGACAAARVNVDFDLADVAAQHGQDIAAELEDDLHHLAPDLLRWHLPRVERGRTTITPTQTIVLRKPGENGLPQLYLTTPPWSVHGPQRLTLHFGSVQASDMWLETDWRYCAFWRDVVQDWTTSRHLWDVRHTSELRERSGGDAERTPFFNPDGTARPPHTPDDRPLTTPERTERITELHERGEVEAAFAAAGIELDTAPLELASWASVPKLDPLDVFGRMPLALTRLEPEMRRLAEARAGTANVKRFWIPHTQHSTILLEPGESSGLRVQLIDYEGDEPDDSTMLLPEAHWRRLPDLDLMRGGDTPAEHLHPLVRDALFPDHPSAGGPGGPPGPELPSPVRVRCGREWHEVASRDGVLDIPHSQDEVQREQALRAFGGANAGCFAVQEAWTSGRGRLPRALNDQRRELFSRALHGDTPGVLQLLDAGVDPHARNGRQRTLLHMLHLLDHEELLPRLLAAGLDINARDEEERTPLFVAVGDGGSAKLVQDLMTAGARIDVLCEIHDEELSLLRLLEIQMREDELEFLNERILTEHPELAEEE